MPVRGKEDVWEWDLGGGDGFSVKVLRNKLDEVRGGGDVRGGETSWCHLVLGKVNIFIWRAKLGRIPTREALYNRGIDLDSVLCPRCRDSIEDVNHALLGCCEVKEVWERFSRWWGK